jgi:hypothetical protein
MFPPGTAQFTFQPHTGPGPIQGGDMKVLRTALLAAGLLASAPGKPEAGLLLSAWLDGKQEGLDSVKAKGVVGIKLNDAMDSALVYGAFNNLSGPITSAHLHAGVRGINGPPVVTITGWLKGNSIATTWAPIARSTVDSLLRGLFYVNVHTAAHPNGEIRGQVELERDLQFTAEIKGRFEKDSVATAAEGIGFFQLSADDSTLSTWVVYRYPAEDEADTLTMAHFHVGPKGENGPVAIDLTADTSAGFMMAKKSLTSPMNGITSAAFLDSLKKGSVYINFHSKKHAGGLMRGQLTASQERFFPSILKGNTAGVPPKGLAITYLSDDGKMLWVRASYTGLTGSVTAAHLHKGTPVVVPIDSAMISATGIAAEIPRGGIHRRSDDGLDLLERAYRGESGRRDQRPPEAARAHRLGLQAGRRAGSPGGRDQGFRRGRGLHGSGQPERALCGGGGQPGFGFHPGAFP